MAKTCIQRQNYKQTENKSVEKTVVVGHKGSQVILGPDGTAFIWWWLHYCIYLHCI